MRADLVADKVMIEKYMLIENGRCNLYSPASAAGEAQNGVEVSTNQNKWLSLDKGELPFILPDALLC